MENKKMPISISIITLILGNLIPLIGVITLGWSPMEVLAIYWMETLVIGILNVFKMIAASPRDMAMNVMKFFMIPFFIVHFGIFVLVQGVFILLVIPAVTETDSTEVTANIVDAIVEHTILGLWWPAAVLFGSHLFSFFWNYIGKKEYLKVELGNLMFKPYSRVIVQQFIAIFGVMLAAATSSVILIVVLVIIFKTAADAFAHIREHRKLEKEKILNKPMNEFGAGREK
jgi:hypothetical protein